MITISNRYSNTCVRVITAAAFIVSMGFVSGQASASGRHHEEKVEVRIKDMHDNLSINPAQEVLWAKVAETMQEDAKVMDKLTQARADHAKDMTAIDDLKSYAEITTAHADGIKNLIPVFSALYDSMSDEQKKAADTLFRHVDHKHGHKKPADK
ncbi:Spy/CpxP family protein refolding chaperone [Methylomonas paludis]|uniref:Spy/CpxP family protein refolding chaperone n=1 Tax=Methylomonas paludis TaxID=1173101 RepID=A0A975R7N2_9GAMM|nr:Spy/CpxP family protein refolding chaperone [Methylomonas paludis]QWF69410.1 Spy/CpxP family protein refolding chaperone [Methylomonas paludis]